MHREAPLSLVVASNLIQIPVERKVPCLGRRRSSPEADVKEISIASDPYSFDSYSLEGRYAGKTIEAAFENAVTIYDAS